MSINRERVRYRMMLTAVSEEMKNNNVDLDMVKLSLFNHVSNRQNLEKAKSAFDLFLELDNEGLISQTDLSVIIAMSELIRFPGICKVIGDHGFPNQKVVLRQLGVFSEYRIRIIEIGFELSIEKAFEKAKTLVISNDYASNQWKFLLHLQDLGELPDLESLNHFARGYAGFSVPAANPQGAGPLGVPAANPQGAGPLGVPAANPQSAGPLGVPAANPQGVGPVGETGTVNPQVPGPAQEADVRPVGVVIPSSQAAPADQVPPAANPRDAGPLGVPPAANPQDAAPLGVPPAANPQDAGPLGVPPAANPQDAAPLGDSGNDLTDGIDLR